MTLTRILTTTSVMALSAGPVMALTAEEVWSDWQSLIAGYGATVSSAGETKSGDTLTVSGLSAEFSADEGAFSATFGDIVFSEQSDGSVVMTMADVIPFAMNIAGPDGEAADIGFTITQPGGQITVSGAPEDLRYDFNYPSIGMSDFTMTGTDIPEDLPMTFDLVGTNATGFMAVTGSDTRTYSSESNIEDFSMSMNMSDPSQGSFDMVINMANLAQTVAGTFSTMNMNMSASELVQSGMTQNGSGSYGPATMQLAVDGPDGAFEIAAAAEGGSIDMVFDETGMSYGGVNNGVTLTVGGAAIPLPPLTFSMDRSEGRFAMPIIPDPEQAQDFGVLMTMEGLKVDDMLWGMIDPAGLIPRDPATLVVDLAGTAVVTDDITDPDFAENMTGAPGTLETLGIKRIQLSAAGAELTGDGDFAFNNDFGIPMPSGKANIMLQGGNGLLDTLVSMGLVPEDQAMGARMMLGLFARPGDGPDTLVSTIEVNEDGSILANGQRIK